MNVNFWTIAYGGRVRRGYSATSWGVMECDRLKANGKNA